MRLPLVLFAIRTSEHATTGFSPFALTCGREARLPWDILYGPAPNTPTPLESWVAERKLHMTKVFQMVKEHTGKKQLHQKEYFDRNRKGKFQTFDIGELVMFLDPSCRSKMGKVHRPWSGPYKVMEKLTDALYKVELGPDKVKIVNTERLKKYFERRGRTAAAQLPTVGWEEDGESDVESELSEQGDESSDEEQEVDGPRDRGVYRPEVDGRRQRTPSPVNQGRLNNPEPLMGHRGELWANLNPRNIIEGGRRNRR